MHNHKICNTKSYKIGEKLYSITTETEKRFLCYPGCPELILDETTPVTKYLTDDIVWVKTLYLILLTPLNDINFLTSCPMLDPAPTEAELTKEERTTIKEKIYQRFGNGVVFVCTKKSLETDVRLPNGPWVNTYKKDFPEVKREPPVSFP